MSLESPMAIPASAKVVNVVNAPAPARAKSVSDLPFNSKALLAVPQ